ncbi:hypothetical protein BU24DRAFT_427949 [Aaosphaeria arxii CBS 175.79]|uniref:Uncharacterized protein n=1 Tax=Aaosphaeria arxii CBS 175.79 TaxID=1450172 RepID=A0A6A5XAW9_9PLEO|nr:uncharacterized protein BU24DRAFT_427949 [Aaosphaeria arxii CBS 175.79]KAF2009914.1 hypothetical protein BU24DRAFT_427949 [Aaosphaeria arxii CBS 175.79]
MRAWSFLYSKSPPPSHDYCTLIPQLLLPRPTTTTLFQQHKYHDYSIRSLFPYLEKHISTPLLVTMRVTERSSLMRLIQDVPLWSSRIGDLATLQQNHSESFLVALDIERSSQPAEAEGSRKRCGDISEIGIAVQRLNGPITQPYTGIKQLYDERGADAFTVRIRERTKLPKEKAIGEVIESNPNNVATAIKGILSKYNGDRILVGFDLHHEFKWIVEDCPSIIPYFTAWLDVQEMASQRCKEFEPAKLPPSVPGLSNVLKAMNIQDERCHMRTHYAANDALRSLIVLCGLASDPSLLSDMYSKPDTGNVSRYSQLICSTKGTYHPFMASISSIDGEKLPPWSPRAVSQHFATYSGLKAVGLNWRREVDKMLGVRFWQLSFHNIESLNEFIAEVNGSTIDGTKLLVTQVRRARRADRQMHKG